jgi:hypothetical protein
VLNDEGVAVILSVLCLAAGYRQQLPSAGFGIEPGPIALESLHQLHQPLKLQLLFGLRSDAGIDAGMHRHILEPVASEVPMMRCSDWHGTMMNIVAGPVQRWPFCTHRQCQALDLRCARCFCSRPLIFSHFSPRLLSGYAVALDDGQETWSLFSYQPDIQLAAPLH